MTHSFSFHRVLIVADIFASADPTFSKLFRVNFRVHQWAHAVIVERVRLQQVDYIEAVGAASDSVRDPEVVPLRMPAGVVVGLQDQVVLELIDLDRAAQVGALEPGFKHQGVIVSEARLVVRSQDLIVVTVVHIWCSSSIVANVSGVDESRLVRRRGTLLVVLLAFGI